MKFTHIINPVKVSSDSDLNIAQPITFRSMTAARSASIVPDNIQLCTVSYEEDSEVLPIDFMKLSNLKRSVLDVGKFYKPRKLPLLKDILSTAIYETHSDFIIYTNVDISLQPYFYDFVAHKLNERDALIINRRTIEKSEDATLPLSFFYQQIGKSHPGFDCFIFHRNIFDNFHLGDSCIGANWIGRILICNILAYSKNPEILEQSHLTFHLGDDRSWKISDFADYDEHNENVVSSLILKIHQEALLDNHPLLQRTYNEFYLKNIDPDPNRPKSKKTHNSSKCTNLDLMRILPNYYKPSTAWTDYRDNVLPQDPLFIVGHPRSGTTLLQSLVATQYALAIFPETHFFSIVRSKLIVKDDIINIDGLNSAIEFIRQKLDVSDSLIRYIEHGVKNSYISPKMLFEAIVFDQLTKNINPELIPSSPWMEKTPDHVEHLDVISKFYPNAKFINIIRNPEKAILSRRKHFTWNKESLWPIDKHIDRWLTSVDKFERFMEINPESTYSVRFEDLISNRNREIRRICDFLKIKFDINKLEQYPHYSRQQNLSWETWKSDTEKMVSTEVATKADQILSELDKERLVNRASETLRRYGYIGNDDGKTTMISHFFNIFSSNK